MTQTGRIGSEIKQSRGFDSIQQEALITLLRTADWARRILSQEIEQVSDLTQQQYNVLRILRGAGDEGLPTLQIAERMVEHTPGITRLIDRLIKKGLVDRIRCPHDRRQVLCSITKDGLAALKPMDKKIDGLDKKLLGHLPNKKLKDLIKLLDEVLH